MKRLILAMTVTAVAAAGISRATAGDREWAVAGKVLTGVLAAGVVAKALHPEPVYVYSAPPPVVYAPPPVVYAPPAPVVYAPPQPVVVAAPAPVILNAPIVAPAPVCVSSPVIVAAPPVVYGPPVYYAPPRVLRHRHHHHHPGISVHVGFGRPVFHGPTVHHVGYR